MIGGRKESVCMPKNIEEQNLVSCKILLSFTPHSVGNATVLYYRHSQPKRPKHIFSNVSIGYTHALKQVDPRVVKGKPITKNG